MRRLFGTDGIRGIANEELSCERAMQIGRALGCVLSSGRRYRPKVIIGMDTRISSQMIASAIRAGLCSVGGDVLDLGVIPTPAVAYLVKKYNAKAGIMISASHNPYEYNGIKIFGEEGYKLSDELEEQIESIVLDSTPPYRLSAPAEIGRCDYAFSAKEDYIDHLLSTLDTRLDGLRVGIDAANGAASVTVKELFERSGAECYTIFCEPNGRNINDECGSTSLDSLKEFVKENKLDVGIALDGDADRCLATDEFGNEVDGDFIMAILSSKLKSEGELNGDAVVGTVMTNYGFTKFCEENGIKYHSAKVGDRFVLEMMKQEGYSIGGEQSGHIILSKYATTGDGQLTALTLLSYMKKCGKSLYELSKIMRKYPQYTVNIPATQSQKLSLFTDGDIKTLISSAEKELCKKGRIVIRPSGTEPLIRIMVEGEDSELIKTVANDVSKSLEILLKGY